MNWYEVMFKGVRRAENTVDICVSIRAHNASDAIVCARSKYLEACEGNTHAEVECVDFPTADTPATIRVWKSRQSRTGVPSKTIGGEHG